MGLLRTTCGRVAGLLAAAACAGCVVLPVTVYVAEPGEGTPVYEACSLTPELPIGVEVHQSRLRAIVSIVPLQGGLVRVQFDIPEGATVVLRENTIRVDAKDGTPARFAAIAHVNPAAPARSPETPAMQKLVLPVDAPLQGGRVRLGAASSDKHYWVAAPVGGGDPGRRVDHAAPARHRRRADAVQRDPLRAPFRGRPRAGQLLVARPAPAP